MSLSDLNAENLIRLLDVIYDLHTLSADEQNHQNLDVSPVTNTEVHQHICNLI